MGRARDLIEHWFADYPPKHQDELRTRLRLENDAQHQHLSAFFELFLHALFRRLGFHLTIHPSLPGGQPDFLVDAGDGVRFYVEAKLVSGMSNNAASEQAQKALLHDYLNEIDSPDFFVEIGDFTAVGDPPPRKRVVKFIRQMIDGADWEEVSRQSLPVTPLRRFEHGGWVIEFGLIPKGDSRGEPGVRTVGMTVEGGWAHDVQDIRKAVSEKGGKYGEFGEPFLVALNMMHPGVSRDDYGEVCWANLKAPGALSLTQATPESVPCSDSTRSSRGLSLHRPLSTRTPGRRMPCPPSRG